RLPAGDAARVELPDRAARDARADADEALPAPARGADVVPVAAGQHAHDQPLGPGQVHQRLRRPGGVALAGLLPGLARDRGVAVAGSQVRGLTTDDTKDTDKTAIGKQRKKEEPRSRGLDLLSFPCFFSLSVSSV